MNTYRVRILRPNGWIAYSSPASYDPVNVYDDGLNTALEDLLRNVVFRPGDTFTLEEVQS